MAANYRPLCSISGSTKRRYCDVTESDPDRPTKRISPFHNTPIQKKETKRRILKISLRKMKGIECPETFLRRSVLINNLARSLQDDLKDDKLWDRWGLECDLDMFPPSRAPHPAPSSTPPPPHAPYNTCTLLTNTSSAQAASQWTLGTHAQWGVDDAHLSPLERERVTRDLAQSHDRLGQTVDRLASFGDDSLMDSLCADRLSPAKTVTSSSSSAVTSPPSSAVDLCSLTAPLVVPELCSCGVAVNCTSHSCNKTKSNCPPPRATQPAAKTTSQAPCSSARPDSPYCQPPDHQHSPAYKLYDAKPDPCKGSRTNQTSECWKILEESQCTSTYESTHFSDLLLPACDLDLFREGASGDPAAPSVGTECPLPAAINECELSLLTSSKNASKRSPDMTSSMDLWTSGDSLLDSSSLQAPPSTVTCSAEDRLYTNQQASPDQDKFTSQALRDFDVIYNNLVSVLIGGN